MTVENKSSNLADRVLDILHNQKFVMLSTIAKECGISELEAARALPVEMRSFCQGEKFLKIWEGVSQWPRATFIMCHAGNVLEIVGKIPAGKVGNGYLNLAPGEPLGGHIRYDSINDICFLSMPFMGRESHSIQFFDANGAVLFSIYVGRENHILIPQALADFQAMRTTFGKEIQMKSMMVYSSQTGNTEKICRAAAETMPNCEVVAVENASAPQDHALIAVGYWVDKGMPDAKAKAYLESISNMKVALLGTLGAWPDSDHARQCQEKAKAMLAGRGNVILGSFMCQGKIDPNIIALMQKIAADVHPMTDERKALLAEAAKHPDEKDCENARNFMRAIVAQMTE